MIVIFYQILYSLIDVSLDLSIFLNDFIYSTDFLFFSFSDLMNLLPPEFSSLFIFFLVELGFTTSLNMLLSFLAFKASLRLIPYIGRLF